MNVAPGFRVFCVPVLSTGKPGIFSAPHRHPQVLVVVPADGKSLRDLWSAAACRRFSYAWNCSRWEFSALTPVERRKKSGSKFPHSKSRPGRSRSTINFGCVDILLRSAPVQTCHPESPRPSQKNRRGGEGSAFQLLLSARRRCQQSDWLLKILGSSRDFTSVKRKRPDLASGRTFLRE